MTLSITFIHCLLAIILFLIINWIGKHSYSFGYRGVSLFLETEDAPAVNYLIRVLSPIVYLIIVSSIIYSLNADRFIHNIYLVNVYYIFFRFLVGMLTNRFRLINWVKQFFYWISIVVLSIVVYDKIIRIKKNILPDFSSLSNELWIIIIIFIFQVFNGIEIPNNHIKRRKENYVSHQYHKFKKEYGQAINRIIDNDSLKAIAYAILIYESFNRPYIIRLVENMSFYLTRKPHTLGVMQVLSDKIISDKESVKIGVEKVQRAYLNFKSNYKANPDQYYDEQQAYQEIISDYNGGVSYTWEVSDLALTILTKFYPSSQTKFIESRNE